MTAKEQGLPAPKYLAKLSKDGEWAELCPADDWSAEMWAYGTEPVYTADQMRAYALAALASDTGERGVVERENRRLSFLLTDAEAIVVDMEHALYMEAKNTFMREGSPEDAARIAAENKVIVTRNAAISRVQKDRRALRAQPAGGGAKEPGNLGEFVIALLIAGGYVTQAKCDEARKIAMSHGPYEMPRQASGAVTEALIVAMAENYEMVTDEGYYMPNDHERTLLVAFAHEVSEALAQGGGNER